MGRSQGRRADRGDDALAPLRLCLRALLVWVLFILAEVFQGVLRRAVFGGDAPLVVRQISTGLGVLIFFTLTWFSAGWLRLRGATPSLAAGALWAVLTFVFEAGLGRLLGMDWRRIAADYDVRQGGLMGFGLAAVALTPWLVWRLRADRRTDHPAPGQFTR